MHFLTKPQIQTKSSILIPTKRLIMTVIAGRGNSLLLATWLLKSTFSIVWRFFFFLFPINQQLRATGNNFTTRNISWVFLMLQSPQFRLICYSLVNTYLNMHIFKYNTSLQYSFGKHSKSRILNFSFGVFFQSPLLGNVNTTHNNLHICTVCYL